MEESDRMRVDFHEQTMYQSGGNGGTIRSSVNLTCHLDDLVYPNYRFRFCNTSRGSTTYGPAEWTLIVSRVHSMW